MKPPFFCDVKMTARYLIRFTSISFLFLLRFGLKCYYIRHVETRRKAQRLTRTKKGKKFYSVLLIFITFTILSDMANFNTRFFFVYCLRDFDICEY